MLGSFWLTCKRLDAYTIDECLSGISLSIRPGGYCIFDQDRPTNGRHYHHCFELCIATAGRGEFVHGDEVYEVRAGDIFIADPGVLHEIRLRQPVPAPGSQELRLVFFVLTISPGTPVAHDPLSRVLLEFTARHALHKARQPQVVEYLTFLDSYHLHGTHFGIVTALRNTVIECLMALRAQGAQRPVQEHVQGTTLDRALTYIGDNIHRKIYIEEIAQAACTSVRNLQLLFKRYLGVTTVAYINERKLAIAAAYLRMNFKIDDIIALIGITDLSHFSRLFKRHYGISPKKYQLRFLTDGMVYGAGYATPEVKGAATLTAENDEDANVHHEQRLEHEEGDRIAQSDRCSLFSQGCGNQPRSGDSC
ncbi:MAG TPA: AraC family transcriptional regulator [Armatimonadota bacterium]|jgi:AraC-like DNA-binding protein